MNDLKPCPFCGGKAVMNNLTFSLRGLVHLDSHVNGEEKDTYDVSCSTCEVTTGICYTEEKTKKLWNQRVEENRKI